MSKRRLYVYGAGGHGKVVADILLCMGDELAGFLDDSPGALGRSVLGHRVVGGRVFLEEECRAGSVAVALGIGDNRARAAVAKICVAAGAALVTAVHPRAVVAKSAHIGEGAVIMACAAINPDAHIGRGAIVNTAAVVEHDVRVGDFAHVSPNSALGGASGIGAFSQLGTSACVLPLIHVGEDSIIGAGAVVARDVPGGVVARGIPARVTRQK